MSKPNEPAICLVAGLGVDGDAHSGQLVQHRARLSQRPLPANLRQVHLIHAELHDELRERWFELAPGEMGENITTRGIDLLSLPVGTRLRIGHDAVVEVTGLRNPCVLLDGIKPGLKDATLERDADGNLVRKAGIMGIVLTTGDVRPGDAIRIELPPALYRPLEPV